MPLSFKLFDWQDEEALGGARPFEGMNRNNISNPKSVLCQSGVIRLVRNCWEGVKDLPDLAAGEERVVAFRQDLPPLSSISGGGHGSHGWGNAFKRTFLDGRKFSHILFMNKDMWHPRVRALPCGFTDTDTVMPNGQDGDYYSGDAFIRQKIEGASFALKRHAVLAAWGANFAGLDQRLPSRADAIQYANASCLVNRTSYGHHEYWAALQAHRFILAPSGQGLFSPKQMEALLMLTIPIVQRGAPSAANSEGNTSAWDESVLCYGWPMVVVTRWEEITQEALERWWRELSPRLHAARSNLLARSWFENAMGHGPESRSAACRALARSGPGEPDGVGWK